ncbi:MAG TPA: hypothetical protein VH741_11305 [Candidatus Limnocylindrales bacterium]|jgi:hypothetical protein
MQYVLALLLAGLTAWLISAIGAGTIERAISAFAQLVGGWRPDGWPRGVQEEDRDRPWTWLVNAIKPAQPTISDSATAAPTTRIRSRTAAR